MRDNIYVLLLISMGGVFLLVISFIIIFVRHQKRLRKQREELQRSELMHQQELLKTVIVSQEAERKRIGQDLHDDVGTALSNLRITIEMFKESDMDRHAFSDTCKKLIDRAIQDTRHISHNLSPSGISLYGFMGALEELTEFITSSGKLQINLHDETGDRIDELGPDALISLYRVLEELLNNTLKHANASTADIIFTLAESWLQINYHDDGSGIPATVKMGKGIGQQNIESRLSIIGALFSLESSSQTGFNMMIKVKLSS
ncbi:sensor histidine kinase [Pedobacter gandavensis]|uniref:sensor histidine kinase n=1 Tax=Pedobacter gandavensis TaxID=2679963 RepID=UPI00292CCF31|nr:histidine kinase [Pedobacter gandavensis]